MSRNMTKIKKKQFNLKMRCFIAIKPDKASTQMINLFAKI